MNNRIITSLCILGAILCTVPRASAQGSLTPPGAPAPTMLTLNQVEPRTAITSAPYTVSGSGSYYLTTNITVGTGTAITINASGVTLDLSGFTISSTATNTNGRGIQLASGVANITILNGHITGGVTNSGGVYAGTGFSDGINYASPAPSNVRVSGLSVSGCQNAGIFFSTNTSTEVDSCTVNTVGGVGIAASIVTRSTAYQCGNIAIQGNIASDCYGYSTGNNGLVASFTANNCYGLSTSTNNPGDGLDANNANNCFGSSAGGGIGLSASIALNCWGHSDGSSDGLFANHTANSCYGASSTGTGLSAQNANFCFGSSVVVPGNYYNMPTPSP
jgi:hypothetical protein